MSATASDGVAPLFGAGPVTVLHEPVPVAGSADLDRAVGDFRGLVADAAPVVRFARCRPTAAFSRRDTLLPGYASAVDLLRDSGFEPVVRPVGGRLALYDEGSLVVHCHAGHPDPRLDITRRFQAFADVLVDAFTALGVTDARVGQVPGEYCEGAYSVNVAGRHKLAGTGQRLGRNGYLFSAVITVTGADRLREALTRAYRTLALDFLPESVGSVEAGAPGLGVADVEQALSTRLVGLFGGAAPATP